MGSELQLKECSHEVHNSKKKASEIIKIEFVEAKKRSSKAINDICFNSTVYLISFPFPRTSSSIQFEFFFSD